jgi:hypothetical protein
MRVTSGVGRITDTSSDVICR